MTQTGLVQCERCGSFLAPGSVVCPNCGALVWRVELQRLAEEAQRLEQLGNLPAAAMTWQRALSLLPPQSQQYHHIYHHVGALAAAMGYPVAPPAYAPAAAYGHPAPGYAQPPVALAPPGPKPPDTWPVAILKTGGSMLISMVIYWFLFVGLFADPSGAPLDGRIVSFAFYFALGFVVLILVHELGHSWAMWHYKLSASPPIFYPLIGAVINLRQAPPDARVEAVVGIGGPLLGSVGALICLAIYLAVPGAIETKPPNVKFLFLMLTAYGAFLNLFNLLPIPPLDGGRVAAAISPGMWVFGIVALLGWVGWDLYRDRGPGIIKILILLFAWPRVVTTLRRGWKGSAYYTVSRRATLSIAALYLGLAVVLAGVFFYADDMLPAERRLRF